MLVAICSNVIATSLFFRASHMVRIAIQKLDTVEATQSMEVFLLLSVS